MRPITPSTAEEFIRKSSGRPRVTITLEAIKKAMESLSIRSAAKKLGVSYETIRRRLRE